MRFQRIWLALAAALLIPGISFRAAHADEATPPDAAAKVSYYRQIRPIFQAHCQGCHQPAKDSGGYVMTAFDQMLAGGESETAAVVRGKPADSYLLELIRHDEQGAASMPKDRPALSAAEIELIEKWIAQGAADDTPAAARQRYDQDHPPVYTRQPVITALDYSPDGKLLAVSGFHEVLLVDTASDKLAGRLVGLSERIQSIRFSPDGQRLAVVGGLPSRMGEVQIWDVAARKLLLSVPTTYDTLYGASWSPDGKTIAFGCADNTVRAIDAQTGKQVLFQGAHTDWVRATVFSKDGSHLISVDRDGSAKLTEVATERFVDNITSITPGALKGGLTSVARHPERDEVVLGGSDGQVKVYRVFRITARRIGDDANLIRKMPPMQGRIFDVAVSRDGQRIAAVSSLDGHAEVHVYAYNFNGELPDDIKAIQGKTVRERTAEDNQKLQAYHTQSVKVLAQCSVPETALYAVAFAADGRQIAAAGGDGQVRIIDAATGAVVRSFDPAPLADDQTAQARDEVAYRRPAPQTPSESLPEGAKIKSLTVEPKQIKLAPPAEYAQLVVQATLENGDVIDVTRMIEYRVAGKVVAASPSGLVQPLAAGQGQLQLALGGQQIAVPVTVADFSAELTVDFIRDVNPVLSRLGCNQGTCHGSAKGKNGFKLSLRGYDPLFDVRALTDDLSSRRVNLASPDDSLMLLKATGAVPHTGGKLIERDDIYYGIIRRWIEQGATLNTDTPRVTKIDLYPQNPVVQKIGSRQQVRVLATYADGAVRDVTHEAFAETGNMEVATANRGGLLTSLRRGEAPILARYEGAYAATTLAVMGDRTGFEWKQPPVYNRIDELTAAKWQRMKILPSGVCSDTDFIRRVYLDLIGLPPEAEDVRAFLADTRDARTKRAELVDRLIGSDDYIEYWTNKWADLLQVNRKFLGAQGAAAFRAWIREQIAGNRPYDEFVRDVITASGSNKEHPAASYYKILREPVDIMENTTHLFLGVRFNCNKCHDHPFERWTQDQYYETAAYFARVGLKADPASGDQKIGGSAVEGAKPLYEMVFDKSEGEVIHDRTGEAAAPAFPFECDFSSDDDATRRQQLAAWLTSADNPYFARSYVNRVWGYLFGVGIMEPIDDLRAGNPPSNPELLDYLTEEFRNSGFNVRHLMQLICKSRTYQLSVASNRWNEDDTINYSHAVARRLPAEVLYDAIHRVTGATSRIPGVPPGTRAAALPDSGVELPSGFLSKFGRPPRESACECERVNTLELGPVMALISGPTLAEAISNPQNALATLVNSQSDDRALINELFLRVLNRPATEAEISAGLSLMQELPKDHEALAKDLAALEAKLGPGMQAAEAKRQEKIAAATKALETYQKSIAEREAELDRQHAGKLAQAQAALAEYDKELPAKLAQWEAQAGEATAWEVLDPHQMKATFNAKFAKEKDGSIFVTGANNLGSYQIVAKTPLANITGIRLEVLADDRLPGKGPGRAQNGNFVLSEFKVEAAPVKPPEGQPAKPQPVQLHHAQADFSQGNYDVATAIDGKAPRSNNGWAVSPQFGKNHVAGFEAKTDIGFEGGTELTFHLDHQYQDRKHTIGKFRLSVTSSTRPIRLDGLPAAIAAIVQTPADKRTEKQHKELLDYYRGVDADRLKLAAAVEQAKKPRPIDSRLKRLQDALARASEPLPIDPELARLRADVKTSSEQLTNARLTAVQDLTWALINSPAFLFNH